MNTACPQKSASGVRTSCTLKPPKVMLIHQRHSLSTSITPANPSNSFSQAAQGLRAHAFQALFGPNLLQQELTAQTQAPLGR
jgi:hypothetical protein